MINLRVGSFQARKGIEYSGIFPQGNSIKISDKTRLSINRTPFDHTQPQEIFTAHPQFTYSFEKDVVITLYRDVNDALDFYFINKCNTNVALTANTESANICAVTVNEEILANKGTYAGVAYVKNDSNSNRNIDIDFKIGGTSVKTDTIRVKKHSTKAVSISGIILTTVTTGKEYTFTLKASGNKCSVEGILQPSFVQITKKLN